MYWVGVVAHAAAAAGGCQWGGEEYLLMGTGGTWGGGGARQNARQAMNAHQDRCQVSAPCGVYPCGAVRGSVGGWLVLVLWRVTDRQVPRPYAYGVLAMELNLSIGVRGRKAPVSVATNLSVWQTRYDSARVQMLLLWGLDIKYTYPGRVILCGPSCHLPCSCPVLPVDASFENDGSGPVV
jgi:hypothetical protein